MRTAQARPLDTPVFYSTGSSNQTPTMRSISILRLRAWIVSAFHLARMDLSEGREMAELFPIDQIFDNPGYPGLLANAFIDAGIPAFTPEIGAPRILDRSMIPLFGEGTMNLVKHHGIIAGPMGRTGRDTDVFVANSGHMVLATH